MRSFTQKIRTSLILVLTVVVASQVVRAEVPAEAIEAYVKAYDAMAKRSVLMFNQRNLQANAQSNRMTAMANARATQLSSQADAQAKMMAAQSAWITAIANARQMHVKTLQAVEDLRTKRLDNDLKYAQTYHEKQRLYDVSRQARKSAYYARMKEKRDAHYARMKDKRNAYYANLQDRALESDAPSIAAR